MVCYTRGNYGSNKSKKFPIWIKSSEVIGQTVSKIGVVSCSALNNVQIYSMLYFQSWSYYFLEVNESTREIMTTSQKKVGAYDIWCKWKHLVVNN